jgi:hypothetical protein
MKLVGFTEISHGLGKAMAKEKYRVGNYLEQCISFGKGAI